MTSTLLTGISELWTLDPALDDPARPGGVGDEQVLQEAALVIEDGLIAWTGPVAQAPPADDIVDLGGRAALPGWGDSHSHLIFHGDRAAEFEARTAGQAARAGGIGITTAATPCATAGRLRTPVRERIAEAARGGTPCLETKTGYGLTVADELRAAELASALIAQGELGEATFLGAHLVPREFTGRAEAYVDLVTGPLLAEVAAHAIGRAARRESERTPQ